MRRPARRRPPVPEPQEAMASGSSPRLVPATVAMCCSPKTTHCGCVQLRQSQRPWPSSPTSLAAGSWGAPVPGCAVRSQTREWVRSAKPVFHHPRCPTVEITDAPPKFVPPTRRRSSFRQRAAEVRSANAPAKFVPPTRRRSSFRQRAGEVRSANAPTRNTSSGEPRGLHRDAQKIPRASAIDPRDAPWRFLQKIGLVLKPKK